MNNLLKFATEEKASEHEGQQVMVWTAISEEYYYDKNGELTGATRFVRPFSADTSTGQINIDGDIYVLENGDWVYDAKDKLPKTEFDSFSEWLSVFGRYARVDDAPFFLIQNKIYAISGYSDNGDWVARVFTATTNGETGVTVDEEFRNYYKVYYLNGQPYSAWTKQTGMINGVEKPYELYSTQDSTLNWLNADEGIIFLESQTAQTAAGEKVRKITSIKPGLGLVKESRRVLYNNDPNKPSVTVKIQTSGWISPPIDNPNPSPIATKKFKNMAATCEELDALIDQCDGNTNAYYVRVEDSAGTVIDDYQVSPSIDRQSQCDIIEQILTASKSFKLWDSATETFDSSLEGCTINIAQYYSVPLA